MVILCPAALFAAEPPGESQATFQREIEADWTRQEKRLGRSPDAPVAVRGAVARALRLAEDMTATFGQTAVRPDAARLGDLRLRLDNLASMDADSRLALYRDARGAVRGLMLRNPLFANRPIAFVSRHRFISQMLHEYIGYYYNYSGLAGGSVFVLESPGRSPAVRDLIAGRLPPGACTTPVVSYDGNTVYFAFCEVRDVPRPKRSGPSWLDLQPAAAVPEPLNYFSPKRPAFHLFAIDADGRNLRQLTDGPDDDFSPCPLPDGGLAFVSSRRGGFIRCNGDVEPVPTYTLHRLDSGGVRTLSFHETDEWHPSVLHDGKIVYSRWDYVDRSAAHFHGLWVTNPDGSDPRILFGNYTKRISACFEPQAIPGSRKILFTAGAHHADVGGALVLFDPARARLSPATGEDTFAPLEVLTPEVCLPEAPDWPKSYYASPWPLSENYFLVAFSFDPLAGWGSKVPLDSETGLYYFDRFGNLELLLRQPGIGLSHPVPLAPREVPPEIPSTLDPTLGEEGEFLLTNVRWSHFPLPADRPVRSLRVYQVIPKTTHTADVPPVGHARQAPARMFLGTVPVESDGSARFLAPARKPLYFQAVDASGRAVQTMRSATYLQPGERRGCVGCHEPPHTTPGSRMPLAAQRPPSRIEPGPDGTRPFSYPRLVQPVLDRHCVGCHAGEKAEKKVVLTGEPAGAYTQSYQSLEPYIAWHSWLGRSIGDIVTRPGETGANASRLVKILDDPHHAGKVQLSRDDRLRINLWLDGNSPFYGTYDTAAQEAQRRGEAISLPALQ
jgi:hypothetical protein